MSNRPPVIRPPKWYLDEAKRRQGLRSDRQLASCLSVSSSMVAAYRRGQSVPSDPVMVTLAKAAGVDIDLALHERHLWRPEVQRSPDVKAAYERLVVFCQKLADERADD